MNQNSNELPKPWLKEEKAWSKMDQQILELSAVFNWTPLEKYSVRFQEQLRRIWVVETFVESKMDIQRTLNDLEKQIEEGSILALKELIYLATEATKSANLIAQKYPEFNRVVAESESEWPVIYSKNKADTETVEALTATIGLDLANPLILRNSVFNPPPEKGSSYWALKLFKAIITIRLIYKREVYPQNSWGLVAIDLDAILLDKLEEVQRKVFEERIKNLPPLVSKNFTNWWKLSEDLLAALSNNRPWEIRELKQYAKSERSNNFTGESAKIKDGYKRSDVNKAVRSSFKTLFQSCCKLKQQTS